jgi:predicted house-cleaning noncanonical NTP pyrophosphatase (MazG superfamily)
MIFNKLVRDKIPAIIESNGQIPEIRILSAAEYTVALEQKLDEETAEFHRDQSVEELADILEVVYALAENLGCSKEELMEVYQKKHNKRGGFRDRVYLISNEG